MNKLRKDLATLKASVSEDRGSLVSQRDLYLIVGYLMFNAACAAPLMLSGTPQGIRIVLGLLLLGAFLALGRLTARRVQALGEFEQLIAYRAMAAAGLVAVWVVLALGVAALAVGFDNYLLIMALGPPEFWLCAALFARSAEYAYGQPDAESP